MTAMGVRIRAAERHDLEAVVSLHVADEERRALIAKLIDAGHCLVACNGDRVVGFVGVRERRFFERDFLELLLVSRDRRRQGIGAALLSAVTAAGGTPVVFTSTNQSNTAMQGLLAGEGWLASGRVTGLDDGDDELFFRVER